MLWLARRMAARRVSSLLAVAGAVLGGAVLVTATGVLGESGWRSHAPVEPLGGVQVVVSADQVLRAPEDIPVQLPERRRVPLAMVDRLAQLPGVTQAIGDVTFPAAVLRPDGAVVATPEPRTAGHGWASARLLGDGRTRGTAPTGSRDVALGVEVAKAAGAEPGDRVRVAAAGGVPVDRTVTAVVAGSGIYVSDPVAERLDEPRREAADLVGLRVSPGMTDSVADAARSLLRDDKVTVSTDRDRGDAAEPGIVASRSLLLVLAASLAGVSLLVTGFVVAGALSVLISSQRRELALLRAVGATPRQVRRLAAGQAKLVTVFGLVAGIPIGYLLASGFRHLLVDVGLLPSAIPLSVSPLPALLAVALLIPVVDFSARCAAWRVSRMPPVSAVTESASEPREPSTLRARIGLLLIAAGTSLGITPLLSPTAAGSAMTPIAGVTCVVGLTVAGPSVVRWIGRAATRRLPPRASAPTWLAVANVDAYALRAAGVVGSLAMVVVFAMTYVLSQTTLATASSDEVSSGTQAQHRIGAATLGGLPRDAVSRVRAIDGVVDVAPVSSSSVVWPHTSFGSTEIVSEPALILDPTSRSVLDLDVRSGTMGDLTGRTVAVGSNVAEARDATVGRTVSLIMGDGSNVRARVVAVYDRALGFGNVVLSRDLARGHTTSALDSEVLVSTDRTVATDERLASYVAATPGLTIAETQGGPATSGADEAISLVNLLTIAVLLGYLLLTIANKLVAMTAQRVAEVGALRLAGATPRQVRKMMRREAAIISAMAIVGGVVVSALPLAFLGTGLLGRPWPAGAPLLLPAIAATVVGIAFVTFEVPTRRALRRPATAAAYAT